MFRLAMYLLGAPRIERDGTPIEVDTRKAIALIAYLAVTGQHHTRDALAALLWPDTEQERARAALRRTLSALNAAHVGEWRVADRDRIGLKRSDEVWIDVSAFQHLLAECRRHDHLASEVCTECLAPLRQAVALYRGDLLAGFTLRDSPDFEDWQFFQAEGLRRDLADALQRLAHGMGAQRDFATAIAYARRWLALDPLHEPAHQTLMQLYAWNGQRSSAIRQYRECTRVLAEELEVRPLAATTDLYEAIRANRVPPPPTPLSPGKLQRSAVPAVDTAQRGARPGSSNQPAASTTASRRHGEYPLVGRSAEWEILVEAYEATGPDGRLFVIEGEAGIGKTRLAEELAEAVRRRGSSVVTARCYEGETNLTYGVFVDGLRSAIGQPALGGKLATVGSHWLSEVARLVPEIAAIADGIAPPPTLDIPGALGRLFEGISQVVLATVRGPLPGIWFFDDLHWADAASLDVFAYLVRRLRGRPIGLIATWRSELVPQDHRLRQMLAEARRAGCATHVQLARLRPADVRELLAAIGSPGAPQFGASAREQALQDQLADRLYRETEGIPFFLAEYLIALKTGVVSAAEATWTLPSGVRGLLRSRLAAVDETCWQVLSTAAVIGRSFDFETLRAASGRGVEEVVTAVEKLIGSRLIVELTPSAADGATTEAGPTTYDFSHSKLRTLVYEELSHARRQLLHRRIAEALIHGRGRRELRPLASQIAHHHQLAGQDAEAAKYFALAGEHARSVFAHTEAIAHFHAAIALGDPDAAAHYETIGDLQTLLGEYAAAIVSYETAAARGRPETRSRIAHKLGKVYHRRGDWDLAERHYQSALDAFDEAAPFERSDERARVYADWSLTVHHRGQTDRAVELARQALQHAEIAGDTRALAQTYNLLGILANGQDNLDEARRYLENSLALAEKLDDLSVRIAARNNLALVHHAAGEVAHALDLVRTALRLCVVLGDRHYEAALHNHLADLCHAVGDDEAAMEHLKHAVVIFREIADDDVTAQPAIWKLIEW